MEPAVTAGIGTQTGKQVGQQQIRQRISRLRGLFEGAGIDTLLLLSDENRFYFSGFTGKDGGFDESAGALLITRDRLIFVTDGRYETQAEEEVEGYEVVCYKRGLADELPELLKGLGSVRLGFEAVRISYALYNKIRDRLNEKKIPVVMQEVDELTAGVRAQKDRHEIDFIRQSLVLTENVFESFVEDDLKPGMSEKQAAWALEKKLRQAGAESLSFPVIAAFGDNSSRPHAVCGDRKLKKDEPILFDLGVVLHGYCSDISRSFVLGQADDTYRKVHDTVYTAQQKSIQSIRPGVDAGAVDRVAREHIEQCGFPGAFVHGLGHGVGLAVHEPPRVSSQSQAVLEEGMVFTVEPGIYLPGWGGVRLENMVVVRADGVEVLNRLDSALMETG